MAEGEDGALMKSFKQGFGWLWNLYRGPVQKLKDVPRRKLLMVPPPVSPTQVEAAAPRLQPQLA